MHRALVAVPGGEPPARPLDRSALYTLRAAFEWVRADGIEVLDDVDGPVTRFLCRAPYDHFAQLETFFAAAVKCYFRAIDDGRLARLMYRDALCQDFVVERVSRAALRGNVEACLHASAPEVWLEHLRHSGALHALLMHTQAGRLELLSRSPTAWMYGLLEV
jgi:hypothetical protein